MKTLLLLAVLFPVTVISQVSYTITVDRLKAKADPCDGGSPFCLAAPQDPVFSIWTNDMEANEFTNCWTFDNDADADYNLWIDIQNLEIANVANVATTWLSFDMEGFESDALIGINCSSGAGDEAVYDRQFVLQLDLATVPENTDHAVTLELGDTYWAEIIVHWIDLTAGLSPLVNNFNFALVPNPTNGVFKVNMTSQGVDLFNVNITDLAGRTVLRQENLSHQSEIDLSGQDAGAYFVNVEVNGRIKTEKILLQ
jgi:hypothetical protein